MKAPLIPGSSYSAWTVIHDSGDIISGPSGQIAFTSRAAFDAWMRGDIVLQDDEWRYGPPQSDLHADIALMTPNQHVLILEEAWGWKFPGECPPMNSAKDGEYVLHELLGGELSSAQKAFHEVTWVAYSTLNRPTPESLFISAWQERVMWQDYLRLEHWEADAIVGPEGEIRFQRVVDYHHVCFVGGGRVFLDALAAGKFTTQLLREGEELMAFAYIPLNEELWFPQETTRQAPAYLAALT